MMDSKNKPTKDGKKLWILHDRKASTPRLVSEFEAAELNKQGWGVFQCVNDYQGARRLRAGLQKINAWYVDLDKGTKSEQLHRLEAGPLYPSRIVESANGYHGYWYASDATKEEWTRIVRWGLVAYYGADPKASDPLRLLRAPGYLHNKRAEEPFEVRVVADPGYEYTEQQMLDAYPDQQQKRGDFTEAAEESEWHIDARVGLLMLNGSPLMNYETFELRPTGTGNYNIVRKHDNYSTGCWVDPHGLIGGCNHGVTLYAWLRWYGNSSEEIKKAIGELREQLEPEIETF